MKFSCCGLAGKVSEIELTGVEVWSVSHVLSFRENGSFGVAEIFVRGVWISGVWNSKNALTGFEKLV